MLNQSVDALNGSNLPVLNRLASALNLQTGQSPIAVYRTIVHRLGPEIAKYYINGGGTADERIATEQDFDPSHVGIDQIKDNIRITAALADSKLKMLESQYRRGTYGRGQQKLLPDDLEATRQRLAGGGQKTVTQAIVTQYAAYHKVDVATATKAFTDKGYTVTQ
jgi:hypothetical protein